jgi:FtsP/CotA-like multicopper oxidase with cupredoxin domain
MDFLKQLLNFVGVFPGPTLEARSGDTMVIEVTNRVENDGISLHWHGLHMKGWLLSSFDLAFTAQH